MSNIQTSNALADTREIFIAEDNLADVRLMREALASITPPVHIRVARDGKEAMRILGRFAECLDAPLPRLIFLDYHLPQTDARCILQFVKRSSRLREIPVIVLTTGCSEESIAEVYGLGANCYLSKPLDLDGFFHTVRAAAAFWLNHPLSQAQTL